MRKLEIGDHLVIVALGDKDKIRLAWHIEHIGEIGFVLGEGYMSNKSPSDPKEWEVWIAGKTAGRSVGVQRDDCGFYWGSKKRAAAALRMIKAEWSRRKRPIQDWEKRAIADGWKPPKAWE